MGSRYLGVVRVIILSICVFGLTAFTDPSTIRQKADLAVQKLNEAIAKGYDVSAIVPKMKRVKTLGQSGKFEETDHLLDEILADFAALNGKAGRSGGKGISTKQFYGVSKPVTIVGYDKDAMEAFISRDGKYLFFNDFQDEKQKKDIHWATRISYHKYKYRGKVKNVNSREVDGVPSMDRNNNFYFVSMKKYSWFNGYATAYSGKFNPDTGEVTDITALKKLSLRKGGWINMDIEISEDGQTLYSTQSYFKKGDNFPSKSYFFYAKKSDGEFIPAEDSKQIFRRINRDGDFDGDGMVYAASISKDERTIFFTRAKRSKSGIAGFRSYIARREDKGAAFEEPVEIKAITGFAEAPTLSADEQEIFYHKRIPEAGGQVFRILSLAKRYWKSR